MAIKNRVVIKNNFAVARRLGDDAMKQVIADATDVMYDTAKTRLARGEDQRGYALNTLYDSITKEHDGNDGKITAPPFYARFFEYGTVYIRAMPFMRPGARAGGNHLKESIGREFVRRVRRASVRR